MVIATLAFVDDKHGLGRINAAVKRAFFCSLKRRFTAYRLEQGRREGRAEEENCCLLVSSGIDDSGCRECRHVRLGEARENASFLLFCWCPRVQG
jgi:hypothetical protein